MSKNKNASVPCVLLSRRDQNSLKMAVGGHLPMYSHSSYTKFVILNGASYEKDIVLFALIKEVSPNILLPVKYQVDYDGSSHFLATDCTPAIRNLCSKTLTIWTQEYGEIELTIHVNYMPVEEMNLKPYDMIRDCFKRRMIVLNKHSGLLAGVDCSNFHSDPDLSEVYFPLWAPPMLKVILQTTCSSRVLKYLSLSRNNISSLKEFSKLNLSTNCTITQIDLSHNKIDWPDLVAILPTKLKTLWLEGNPLCKAPLQEYVNRVTALHPNLTVLDGITLEKDSDLDVTIGRNSFVDTGVCLLVDHFLHHYFKFFHMEPRTSMKHMYHPKATLSLSTNLSSVQSQSPQDNIGLHFFTDLSRNILRISNYSKVLDSFRSDVSQVVFILSSLPFIQLDPTTASVDVPYYVEDKVVQICMSGIFRDKFTKYYWIGFTFILQKNFEANLGEWKIINQMINVSPANSDQIKISFMKDIKPIDTSHFEMSKEELLTQFKELTSMKTSWCEHFLKSTLWDMEQALQSFVDQYKGNSVPQEAFVIY